ncbi:hypothetical protein BDL97_01G026300 [Sphagnum fallax]|nr:hypothetical protein BDL97_01G026300 [Sphagnum fallax]KAH8973082.1 hypothetical protein BDL97_01G026300 [Sphagnum fallax]KAH8973083.1 hypothetical protein BDL97_01G026300 [Sphagnum fallax]
MSQSIFALLLFAMALAFKGGIALNILTAGSSLLGNQTQYLNNSGYYLVMQPDCNLVMYRGSTLATSNLVWQTSTAGKGSDCWLVMQRDGNLVLYNATCGPPCAHWDTVTGVNGVADSSFYFMLQSDGELDIYNFENDNPKLYKIAAPISSIAPTSTGSPPLFNVSLATTPTLSFNGPYMSIGYYFPKMSSLVNGPFSLTLENDCTLQSKNGSSNTVLWETPSNGSGLNQQCELTLQQDGNLQIQTTDTNEILWTTNTIGDSSVNWVLYIDSITGDLSIGDIMQPTHILWKNTLISNFPIGSNLNTHSGKWLILELVGASAGGFLLGIASLVLTYYACARYVDPAQKELQQRLQNSGGKCKTLTLTQIKQATENFKTTIGIGGFGEVYYGKLVNGQEIAVKTLSTTSHQTKQEFFNEIELLSMVHHKYLVSLVGYCLARKHLMLVYEYVSGGDLRSKLHGDGVSGRPLSWRQRTRIILQIAEGLDYLHDKCHPTIIHRDVKSNNILLTKNLEAKVADFGLSKLRTIEQGMTPTHVTTVVKGTPGYLDPEYQESGMLTNKSDVYSFGIVLMEILTGQTQLYIAHRVTKSWRSNQIGELVDPNIKGEFNENEFSKLVELSLLCVMKKSSDRPSMTQVVQMLRKFQLEQIGLQHCEDSDNNEHNPYVRPSIPSTSSFESNGTSSAKELEEITPLSISNSLPNGIVMTKFNDQ